MQASNIPAKFQIPFANAAGAGYIRTVPVPSQIGITNGAASFTDGFPPNCFIPPAAGGSWPFGQDFNGLQNVITAWLQWEQAGGAITYDSTFQSEIGGYPNGAIVQSAVTSGLLWRSTADNNTTNPDTGGAGWVAASGGRLIGVQIFTASNTYNPTAGTRAARVQLVGGGAAGAGAGATGSGQVSIGSGGNSGSYAESYIIGPTTQTVTVGAGGTGVAGAAGGAGGATSFGTLITAPGGNAGSYAGVISAPACTGINGNSPASGGSIINTAGDSGGETVALSSTVGYGGKGGTSQFGSGGSVSAANVNGAAAYGHGSGGGGCFNPQSASAVAGGNGTSGIVVVWEYS